MVIIIKRFIKIKNKKRRIYWKIKIIYINKQLKKYNRNLFLNLLWWKNWWMWINIMDTIIFNK